MQTIVDHHHPGEHKKREPRVTFTEPSEQKDDIFNDEDEEEEEEEKPADNVEKNEVMHLLVLLTNVVGLV